MWTKKRRNWCGQGCPLCSTHLQVRMYDMRQILSIRPIHVTVKMPWLFWTGTLAYYTWLDLYRYPYLSTLRIFRHCYCFSTAKVKIYGRYRILNVNFSSNFCSNIYLSCLVLQQSGDFWGAVPLTACTVLSLLLSPVGLHLHFYFYV